MPMDTMQMNVWLETFGGTVPVIVAPYVETDEDARLTYRMNVVKSGRSGSTRISQSGTVNVTAAKPAELSRTSVSVNAGDECRLEVEVMGDDGKPRKFSFECPR